VGPGKNAQYRTYRLPCEHEQEFQIGNMRKGEFRCQTCLDNKIKEEAEAQGCVLLGAGKNRVCRTYLLPCGHEHEIKLPQMRSGEFRCQICLNYKLREEAEAQGCKLVGPGQKSSYRTYRLPCGHEQEVAPSNLRNAEFRCQTCLDNKLREEAEAQDCKLVGPGSKGNCRVYRLKCGHERELQISNVRKGEFHCQTCFDSNLEAEAEAQGLVLLGLGKNSAHRTIQLPCGHEQDVQTGSMRAGAFRCQICFDDRLEAEAAAQGCLLLGPGRSSAYRIYRLACGHKQEVTIALMRDGVFRCRACKNNKFKAEAVKHGCKLVGSGRDCHHRTYLLSCGHKQDVKITEMRKGKFHCAVCFANKLKSEAKASGCVLLRIPAIMNTDSGSS